jgi:hydroxyethylthiazole kinase-like uncharacterized protein yjeF
VTARPILTAAETRAAEEAVFATGVSVESLMERAGAAVAEAAWRYGGGMPTLVLCGPGNNGGDGYVVARDLRQRGVDVRVAASAEPRTEAARVARVAWGDAVEDIHSTAAAPLLIDGLFGTGLSRGLDDRLAGRLAVLSGGAARRIAVDVPSGVATDDGALLSPVPAFDLTIALGVLKPAHRLQPAARYCGRVVLADIGLPLPQAPALAEVTKPSLPAPGPADHKYTRGYVAIVSGAMRGASALAAAAAQRAGAG